MQEAPPPPPSTPRSLTSRPPSGRDLSLSPAATTSSFHSCQESSSGLTGVMASVDLHPTPSQASVMPLDATPAPPYSDISQSSPVPPYSSRSTTNVPASSSPAVIESLNDHVSQTPMLCPLPGPFQGHNTLGLNIASAASSPGINSDAFMRDGDATPRVSERRRRVEVSTTNILISCSV